MNVQMASHVMSPSFGFQDHIVVISCNILSAEQKIFVFHSFIADSLRGVFSAPLRVEAEHSFRKGFIFFIIKIKIHGHWHCTFIFHLNSCLLERHREPAVESFSIFRTHLQRCRNKIAGLCMSHAKEVSHRHFHTWLFLSIPVHPKDHTAQIIRFRLAAVCCNGNPDMGDQARFIHFSQNPIFSCCQMYPVIISSFPVIGRYSSAFSFSFIADI